MAQRSTTELVSRARAGDRAAWDEIVDRYGAMVSTVAGSFRLQEADAADAVQNTWLRAVDHLATIRDPERLGGWLRTTARRECLALVKHRRREQCNDTLEALIVDSAPGPEAVLLRAELTSAVRGAVAGLDARRRTMVDVLFLEPVRDYAAASRVLGMPVGSIGPTRARVLHLLRSCLEETGFGRGEPVGSRF